MIQHVDDTDLSCLDIHNVESDERCNFYLNTESCHGSDGKLDYMYFIFCTFQLQTWGGVLLCVLWLLILFIGLGVTADDFLCPSLVVITKTLHLSQNIAGVTFLAFGNGAPDIFSSVAGIEQSRPELVIGTLFGAGIFVTSVVSGSIMVSRPFKVMERPFLRDTIFYVCASFWAFLRFYFERITLWHAIGFVGLYVIYILVVIVSRVIYNRYKSKKQTKEAVPKLSIIPTIDVVSPSNEPIETTELPHMAFSPNPEDDDPEAEGVVLRRFSFRGSIACTTRRRSTSTHAHHEHILRALTQSAENRQNGKRGSMPHPPPLDTQLSKTSMSSLISRMGIESEIKPPGVIKEFLAHICPIDFEAWSESKWYTKVIDSIKAPIYFLLILSVPVVDYENDRNNWCKLLNMLHCVTSPIFIVFAVGAGLINVGNIVPVWSIVLGAGILLGILVYFTSSYEEVPCYHWVYAYLGFATSVMWVYLIASEIVSLLHAIGIVFRLSDAILGLTVLAWGNSIGDFVSNLSVARKGYPRMGISACYGGPLLNLLLGIGVPYTVMIVKNGQPIQLHMNRLIRLLYGSLTLILLSTILTMTALKFHAKRYFGFFLLSCYSIFLVIAILLESKVI